VMHNRSRNHLTQISPANGNIAALAK
jgi:hypothetical protein